MEGETGTHQNELSKSGKREGGREGGMVEYMLPCKTTLSVNAKAVKAVNMSPYRSTWNLGACTYQKCRCLPQANICAHCSCYITMLIALSIYSKKQVRLLNLDWHLQWRLQLSLTPLKVKCSVPENIHTPHTERIAISWGVGDKDQIN